MSLIALDTSTIPPTRRELLCDAQGRLIIVGSGSGSGGGAITVADGANATQGAIADAAVVTDAPGTLSAKLRGLVKILASVWDSAAGRLKVDGSGVTQPVSGPLTDAQLRASAVPVSAAALPLPTGAATAANQVTAGASLTSIDAKTPALGAVSSILTAASAVMNGASVATGARTFSVIASGSVTSGTGSATVAVRGSHDGTVWATLGTITLTLGTTTVADAIASGVPYKFVRGDLTAISGTGASVSATVGV